MKLIPRQKIWLSLVLLANLILWAVPSNVVEQIARDRHTMLGRYSRTHYTWNLAVLVISLVSLYIDSATGAQYKRRWFQVLAVIIALIPSLILIDAVARSGQRVYYVKDRPAYHRVPNDEIKERFVDKPEAARTYPNAPPGYPPIEGTLRTDARGFRNATTSANCDVVALGDSFAEGSNVSDEHPWPVRLAEQTGLSVCNLGMSGYAPLNYLESLKDFGLALKPKYVLCMIYEGNDFRSAKSDDELRPGLASRFSTYRKQSPLVSVMDNLMIRIFGPIRATSPVAGAEILDWMPLAIPAGPEAKFYAFAPKQLADLYRPAEEFANNSKWRYTRQVLTDLRETCAKAQCQLMVIYAPTKAHVTLPLVADRLDAKKVRAFLALDEDEEKLPDAATLLSNLLTHADGRESVVAEWCRETSVPFVSLTAALRQACAEGRQIYFTYDQHWTPIGHETVAAAVAESLRAVVLAAKNEGK